METIGEGQKLLQYDYLGGSGSRGYGKVGFSRLYADVVIGTIEEPSWKNVMRYCKMPWRIRRRKTHDISDI